MKCLNYIDKAEVKFLASNDKIMFKMIEHYYYLQFRMLNSFRNSRKKYFEKHLSLMAVRIMNRIFKTSDNSWFGVKVLDARTKKVFGGFQNKRVVDYEIIYVIKLDNDQEKDIVPTI